jgi:hypothetical protein
MPRAISLPTLPGAGRPFRLRGPRALITSWWRLWLAAPSREDAWIR